MKFIRLALIVVATSFAASVGAQELTELSCNDFRPTPEAQERFPNLKGACERIVERDGELHAQFTAIVRRVRGNNLTLHLPATGHTFTYRPDSSQRVVVGGNRTSVRNLSRGQEIRIYLAVSEFAKPDIEEIAFVTEENVILLFQIETVAALPTTASMFPTLVGAGLIFLVVGLMLRRRRLRGEMPLVVILCAVFVAGSPIAEAETETETETETRATPGRVITSTVKSSAIVESVNKETRELKLIGASGRRYTIVADEMVRNFDQIEPRDRIVTEYLESIAIMVVPAGAPAMGSGMAIEVAALGSKPGISSVDTFMVRATIDSLNVTDRIATLSLEDGSSRTIKVADDVPLDLVSVGDEVRMRVTQAVAVSVRKADDS